jgi:hypothetical protein
MTMQKTGLCFALVENGMATSRYNFGAKRPSWSRATNESSDEKICC